MVCSTSDTLRTEREAARQIVPNTGNSTSNRKIFEGYHKFMSQNARLKLTVMLFRLMRNPNGFDHRCLTLSLASELLLQKGASAFVGDQVAAVSCGITEAGRSDLDYDEDSSAHTDANFVLTATGGIVEIQGTAEHTPFTPEQFSHMLNLAKTVVISYFRCG